MLNGDLVAARFADAERDGRQGKCSGRFFAAFDGFEQEGIGLSFGDGGKAETGVSRSAEMDLATGTRVACAPGGRIFVGGTDHVCFTSP